MRTQVTKQRDTTEGYHVACVGGPCDGSTITFPNKPLTGKTVAVGDKRDNTYVIFGYNKKLYARWTWIKPITASDMIDADETGEYDATTS